MMPMLAHVAKPDFLYRASRGVAFTPIHQFCHRLKGEAVFRQANGRGTWPAWLPFEEQWNRVAHWLMRSSSSGVGIHCLTTTACFNSGAMYSIR